MQLDEARNSYHWGLSSKHVAILYVSETMFAFVEEKEDVCFFFKLEPMLSGYADTDTGTRYGDTLIRYFSKNKDTGIH